MSDPKRIQLRRTKGWRKPEGAVVVSRPSKWGNPWTVADWRGLFPSMSLSGGRNMAVVSFRHFLDERVDWPHDSDYPSDDEIRRELRGHDLACWCPLDEPCHADVLLELANAGPSSPEEEG